MKNNLIRKSCIVALSLVLSMITAGCHGTKGGAPFEIPEHFDDSKHYEITFWAKNDTNKTQTDIYNKAITDFQALYPNITVNMRLYTDYGKIYNDVITNISTNTTPNVCITYPDHIATYMSGKDNVIALDNLFTHPAYGLGGSELKFDGPTKDELIKKFLDECILNGHYYAIPYMRSSEAMYINKTYVEKLGYTLPEKLTWDFVWEVSEKAAQKNSDGIYILNNQNVMIPFIYKSTDNMMIQLLKQKEAGYSDESGNILLFNDETKNILKEIASHVKTGSFSTFKISSYPANFLNAGQCVFAIDSTAGSTWMGSNAPLSDIDKSKFADFETAVYPIPQVNTDNPQMISQGPSICIFNKEDNNEILASWLFAQFLLTNEVQIAYSETEGYVPVTTKAGQSPEYLEYLSLSGTDNNLHYDVKIQAVKVILDNIDNTFITPVFIGSASLRDAAGQLIEETCKSVRRKKKTDEAYWDKLFSDTAALYHLNLTPGDSDTNKNSKDLGPLPVGCRVLLISLVIIWIVLIGYYLRNAIHSKHSIK